MRWASIWYTATLTTYLPLEPLKLAFKRHLGIAVFLPDQTCTYALSALETLVAHHWASSWDMHAAGSPAQTEQEILLHNHATHRADPTARNDMGEHLALDVLVTGAPDPSRLVDCDSFCDLEASSRARVCIQVLFVKTRRFVFNHKSVTLWSKVSFDMLFLFQQFCSIFLQRASNMQNMLQTLKRGAASPHRNLNVYSLWVRNMTKTDSGYKSATF